MDDEFKFKLVQIEFNQLMTEFIENATKAGIEPYPVLLRIARLGILNEMGTILMIGFGIDEFKRGKGKELLNGIVEGILK